MFGHREMKGAWTYGKVCNEELPLPPGEGDNPEIILKNKVATR
jgi:hypothetical protein